MEFLYQQRVDRAERLASGVAVRAKSADGLYEGAFDLFTEPHPSLAKLLGFIGESLAAAVCHAEGGCGRKTSTWPSWRAGSTSPTAAAFTTCRSATAGRGPHGGAPNGGTRFGAPLPLGYRDAGNAHLFDDLDAPLWDGLLVLFPSYLRHGALPYAGGRDRVVIAFNARVFRKGVPSTLRP